MRRTPTPGAGLTGGSGQSAGGCLSRTRDLLPTRVEGLPPLPPEYDAELDAGLAALAVALPDAARRAIADHVRLLLAWTAAINLTAVREPAAVARLHVVDSLSAVAVLRARGVDALVDVGSGGGFPGLALAAALPAERSLLVESVGKKAAFLEAAVAALGLTGRVGVANARVEAIARDPGQRGRWPAVTARAVADMADLVELCLPLVAPGGCLVAWKRGELARELAAAEPAAAALGGGRIEVIDVAVPMLPGHRLVVVEKERASPASYPRDVPERRRRPWRADG